MKSEELEKPERWEDTEWRDQQDHLETQECQPLTAHPTVEFSPSSPKCSQHHSPQLVDIPICRDQQLHPALSLSQNTPLKVLLQRISHKLEPLLLLPPPLTTDLPQLHNNIGRATVTAHLTMETIKLLPMLVALTMLQSTETLPLHRTCHIIRSITVQLLITTQSRRSEQTLLPPMRMPTGCTTSKTSRESGAESFFSADSE